VSDLPELPDNPDGDTEVQTRHKPKVAPPSMYRVILVNDDYTPREFVVALLVGVFNKEIGEAQRIMLAAHQGGKSIVGVYTFDVANSRTERATKEAHEAGFPLLLYTEEV
jgi:ATP-dependent Clp protease adaptor protein ClpS